MDLDEARVVIVEEFADILLDLSDDDGDVEEREALRVAMLDAADIIAEALDLQVVEVVDGIATVRLNIAGSVAVDAE